MTAGQDSGNAGVSWLSHLQICSATIRSLIHFSISFFQMLLFSHAELPVKIQQEKLICDVSPCRTFFSSCAWPPRRGLGRGRMSGCLLGRYQEIVADQLQKKVLDLSHICAHREWIEPWLQGVYALVFGNLQPLASNTFFSPGLRKICRSSRLLNGSGS